MEQSQSLFYFASAGSNNVFVDWDVESQGDLLSNSWTPLGGIALLYQNLESAGVASRISNSPVTIDFLPTVGSHKKQRRVTSDKFKTIGHVWFYTRSLKTDN